MAWCMDYCRCCKFCGLANCGLSCLGCTNKAGQNGDGADDTGRQQVKNFLCFAVNAADNIPNIEDVVNAEDLVVDKFDDADDDANDGLLCLKAIKCTPGAGREPKSKHRRSSPNKVQLRSHTRGSKRCIFPECHDEEAQELRPRGSRTSNSSSTAKKTKKTKKRRDGSSDTVKEEDSVTVQEQLSCMKTPLKSTLKALSLPTPCCKQDSLDERNAKSLDSDSSSSRERAAAPRKQKKVKVAAKPRAAAKRRTARKGKTARKGGSRGKATKRRAKRRSAGKTRAAGGAKTRARGRKQVKSRACSETTKAAASRSRSPIKRDRSPTPEDTTRAASESESVPLHRTPKSNGGTSKYCGNPLSPWMRSCGRGHVA